LTKFIASMVVVAALAVAASVTGKAEAATSCTVAVQTQSGPFHGYVTRSDRTSCPFARNVARASLLAILRAGGARGGSFTTLAYSPVTRAWYRVRCFAYGNVWTRRGATVDCWAGIGAHVVYRTRSY